MWNPMSHTHHLRTAGIVAQIGYALAVLFSRLRLRRRGPRLRVRPAVASLDKLEKDAPALLVANIGRDAAFNVVVSIRVRASAFQFDEIGQLEPQAEAPLLHQGVGRIRFEQTSTSSNWFRIVLRTVARDAGKDLRIPLLVRYHDRAGQERTGKQTLHCDEQLRLRVTNG
jgi:hypothetical protein